MNNKDELKKIYLALPYTDMQESSYKQANEASVLILNKEMNVFSPITHSHPLTQLEGLDVPHTWDYWKNIDYQFIDWADEIYVLVPEEGFSMVLKSTGVKAEIKYAEEQGKKVTFVKVVKGQLMNLEITI